MNLDSNAWKSFLETGKIDDYLNYCQDRKQEMYVSIAEGAVTPDADDNRWDSAVGLQDRG